MITEGEQKFLAELKDIRMDSHLRPTHPVASDGIVLGITTDVVYAEMVELLRLRLASILQISGSAITCQIGVRDGKVIPEINVDMEEADGLTAEQVTEVIQSVWWGVQPVRPGIRDELQDRMRDLGTRRARETT